jgi:hypothetical protein
MKCATAVSKLGDFSERTKGMKAVDLLYYA